MSTSQKRNKSFSVTLAASGGTAPLTWSVAGAPAWVSLNPATGVLSGTTPNATGTFNFTVTVVDAAGATNTVTFTFTVTN
jgi:hypothetical protein